VQEGEQEEWRQIIENLLQVRFGTLDDRLNAIIQAILALPPSEFAPLLVELSCIRINRACLVGKLDIRFINRTLFEIFYNNPTLRFRECDY
jgi:hypothetical protein